MWVRRKHYSRWVTLGGTHWKGEKSTSGRGNHETPSPSPWLPSQQGTPQSLLQKTLFTNLAWDTTGNLVCLHRGKRGSGWKGHIVVVLVTSWSPWHSCLWGQGWGQRQGPPVAVMCFGCDTQHQVWGKKYDPKWPHAPAAFSFFPVK